MLSSHYLTILRESTEFLLLMEELKKQRPVIPTYNVEIDNTEQWKANSNMRRGFDLCLTLLGEDTNE